MQTKGSILFEVKDRKTGYGLAGAEVQAFQDSALKGVAVADHAGRALFRAATGVYAFRIKARGYQQLAARFTIVKGKKITIGVMLDRTQPGPAVSAAAADSILIQGYVVDSASSRPLAGVSIACLDRHASSDENGFFSFSFPVGIFSARSDSLPPAGLIIFSKNGFRTIEMRRYLMAGVCTLTVAMKKGAGRDSLNDLLMHGTK